jgi:hypothetical protein
MARGVLHAHQEFSLCRCDDVAMKSGASLD